MMELTHFDSLLHRFAHRSQAIERDASLIELMQALQGEQLDVLPLPGQGCTLERWRALARIAGCDLSLAKLYESHTDALAILAECGAAQQAGNSIWGVWAAEPPDARAYIVERNGERVRLQGRKAWCSGALQIDRALLTAWEDDQPQLVAIELPHSSQRILAEHWQAVGMAATSSVVIEFDDSPGLAIGSPGQYLSRPGFWQGGAGIAACWYGAAEALADYLREQCRKPRRDPHADAHLGAVDAALYGARAALHECATWIDLHPQDDASFQVRRTRAQVEQAVEQVIQHAGRALGATPFCCSSHFARLSADLPVYIRQSHAERDLAELGRQLTGMPAGAWQL
ncbi:acyl-CoA dehydrogenase [Pseudomonas monteilii]|uniref:Acyl-CoA dehydrogenase n=1 Tax=Pseudomonas monteilii TaxID=76759 RepID=A0AAP7KDW3_9PSED|nr:MULTISPECIES: acyl-CoA dehydrogenase [Pseudomonas]AYN15912.1 acyl-CoA dehydrogenase [Pseudomonas monteilii]AYO00427.1 acyl-CoA dehydrogenase [Pseudomonas sp. LTGT-11-2Z]MBA6103295.1 acyl-CoA dehydrogenase [Pseudomonas monteilii]MCE0872260.1 acyl-CoA dehydrogenase [Pseudomonas monteilii]MCE0925393.1 acyl-CoA dehydrogenase [Pseudomonas monteilii]